MMRIVIFMALFSVGAAWGVHDITVDCVNGLPTYGVTASPSFLKELKLTEAGNDMLCITWAVNIDATVDYLTGACVIINGHINICKYSPPLAEVDLRGLKQVWFNYSVPAPTGFTIVQVANHPYPSTDQDVNYKVANITIKSSEPAIEDDSNILDEPPIFGDSTFPEEYPVSTEDTAPPSEDSSTLIGVAFLVGVVLLMMLTSCIIFYKVCRRNCASGFTLMPGSFTAPVPILLVYPAENPVFQRAVVALAEFLQHHGGCNVAIDMWQLQKIAEQGPMRWLAEQAKSADRVILLCPQLQPFHCPPKIVVSEQSIPAAAQDLYPLVLNMVASHAKSPSELAKFWTVQFGKTQDKKRGCLPVELRACKKFCLMKDLDKLYRNLHSPMPASPKAFGLKRTFGIAYSEASTIKLRDAIGQLAKCGAKRYGGAAAVEGCDHQCIREL